jgi:hypothetical protein
MASKQFDEFKMFRLHEQDDNDGTTFVIQYFTSSASRYKKYVDEFSSSLRDKSFDKWGNQFIAHRTTMELIR